MTEHVLVVGAGVVGISCALHLQREGCRVTVISRDGPGEACSLGNSGGLGGAVGIAPMALPGELWRIPHYLRDPDHPLAIRWSHAPFLLPWLRSFVGASRPERVEQIADARAALLARSMDCLTPLIEAAGARDLVANTGMLAVFESRAALEAASYTRGLAERRGVKVEILTGEQTREMIPALGPRVQFGAFVADHYRTVNPLRFVQALAQSFQRSGGRIMRAEVRDFANGSGAVHSVLTDQGPVEGDRVVIAAGVWSKKLAARLGTRVILEAQRGYHAMLPDARVTVPLMTTLADRNVVLTPMEHGLRITGIAEFCRAGAPPAWRHAERIVAQAKQFIPALHTEGAKYWVGPRPATPDSLPVIGRAPRHANVLFAFGHGQNGMQMAGITGRLIADLVVGRPPLVELAPFRPDRF